MPTEKGFMLEIGNSAEHFGNRFTLSLGACFPHALIFCTSGAEANKADAKYNAHRDWFAIEHRWDPMHGPRIANRRGVDRRIARANLHDNCTSRPVLEDLDQQYRRGAQTFGEPR